MSYASGNKVWLNNKYIKIKQNCKLETKFFDPFQVFCLIKNNLQTRITKKLEDQWYFLYVIVIAWYYKKGVDR